MAKSLKNLDTIEQQVNRIYMTMQHPANKNKVAVWAEGKDWRLYGRFFDNNKIIKCGKTGSSIALNGFNLLKSKKSNLNTIVILDADFRRINGQNLNSDPCIFYTDGHDQEMMCLKYEKVRNGILENFDIEIDQNQFYDDIFSQLEDISFFKWYNTCYNCHYSTHLLSSSISTCSTLSGFAWIESTLYQSSLGNLRKNNPNPQITLDHIDPNAVQQFKNEKSPTDKFELTNGHDFIIRMNFLLKNELEDSKYYRNEEGIKDTIYSYFTPEFEKTNLYNSLRDWCNANVDILKKTAS